MREWIPISTSPKGRLALVAVREFGSRPFAEVTVGELTAQAGVTTGALYHHFESKLGLYLFVRRDVERRLMDRMEGAASAVPTKAEALNVALLVGFDFAVSADFHRLLGEPPAGAEEDPLVDFLGAQVTPPSRPVGLIVGAAWRAALLAVADGAPADEVRNALRSLEFRGRESPGTTR